MRPRPGSSPHVRGARRLRHVRFQSAGIIPACAGSTPCRSTACCPKRDHPRMCGEHLMRALALSLKSGSSPHVRGALNHPCGGIAMLGIIPACAGSTRFHLDSQRGGRDHPRMCGEHIGLVKDNISETGSSPHVRGALIPRLILITRGGIIPACAGSTVLTALDPMAWRDHPRMCGEHRCFPSNIPCSVGSSPHVRGARCVQLRPCRQPGIIPACAGSTDCRRGRVDAAGDHPRMCGEHSATVCVWMTRLGSSPHARGARGTVGDLEQVFGIIPACAGSTTAPSPSC